MRRRVAVKKPNVDNSHILGLCTFKEVTLPLAWEEGINKNGWGIPKDIYISALTKKLEETNGAIIILDHALKGIKVNDITKISDQYAHVVGCVTNIDFKNMTANIKLKKEVKDIEEYVVGFGYNAQIDEETKMIKSLDIQVSALHKAIDNTYSKRR